LRTVAAAAAAPEVRCRAPRARCPDTSTPLACPPCPRAACRCVAPSFTRRCLRLLCAVVLCVVVCVRPEQPLSVLWAIKHHVASACVASKAPAATAAARRLRRWRRQHRQQLAARRPRRVATRRPSCRPRRCCRCPRCRRACRRSPRRHRLLCRCRRSPPVAALDAVAELRLRSSVWRGAGCPRLVPRCCACVPVCGAPMVLGP
jgi:hypothetical protein